MEELNIFYSVKGGDSFYLGILEESDRSKISLSNPKAMIVRSLFMDTEQMDDLLGLSLAIDNALNTLSSKGNESPIIFIDTRNYPDGGRISGNYTQKNGEILLKFKTKCSESVKQFQQGSSSVDEIVRIIIDKAMA